MARLHAVIGNEPLAPFTKPVPPAIEEVVRRALSRSMNERHSTAAELRRDLETALERSGLRASSDDVAALVLAHAPASRHDSDDAIARPSLRKIVGKRSAASESDDTGTGQRASDGASAPPTRVDTPNVETSSSFVGAPSRFLHRRRTWPVAIAIAMAMASLLATVQIVRRRDVSHHAAIPGNPTGEAIPGSSAPASGTSPSLAVGGYPRPAVGSSLVTPPPSPASVLTDRASLAETDRASTRTSSTAPAARRPPAARNGARKPVNGAHVSYEDTIQ